LLWEELFGGAKFESRVIGNGRWSYILIFVLLFLTEERLQDFVCQFVDVFVCVALEVHQAIKTPAAAKRRLVERVPLVDLQNFLDRLEDLEQDSHIARRAQILAKGVDSVALSNYMDMSNRTFCNNVGERPQSFLLHFPWTIICHFNHCPPNAWFIYDCLNVLFFFRGNIGHQEERMLPDTFLQDKMWWEAA